MELKIASMVLFLGSVFWVAEEALGNGIYTMRSAYRQKYQFTDCNLLKVGINSQGQPNGLSYRGHCCDHKKHKDFKVTYTATNLGLQATFQWVHDNRYYLTAKTTGNQLVLEKPGSSITNNHKFIVHSAFTPGCDDCVTIQSIATNKYVATSTNGQISMTTNRQLNRALLRLHNCDVALLLLCRFIDVSC